MKVRKHILSPGVFRVSGQDYHVTPGLLHKLCAGTNCMIASGLSVPVPCEHDDAAKPTTHSARMAASVARNAGWVEKLAVVGKELWADLDITDEELARKLSSIRFCSPEIHGAWTDGRGIEWRDVMTHLALTTSPVFHTQKPFAASFNTPLRFSLADLLDRAGVPVPTPQERPSMPTAPNVPDLLRRARLLLAQLGVPLPEDATLDNPDEFVVAANSGIQTYLADKDRLGDVDPSVLGEDEDWQGRSPSIAEPAMIAFSNVQRAARRLSHGPPERDPWSRFKHLLECIGVRVDAHPAPDPLGFLGHAVSAMAVAAALRTVPTEPEPKKNAWASDGGDADDVWLNQKPAVALSLNASRDQEDLIRRLTTGKDYFDARRR